MFRIPAGYAVIGFVLLGAGTAHSDDWKEKLTNPSTANAIKLTVKDAVNKCKTVVDGKEVPKEKSTEEFAVKAQKGVGKDDATATAAHIYYKATQIAAKDISAGSDGKSWCNDIYLYANNRSPKLVLDPRYAQQSCEIQCK